MNFFEPTSKGCEIWTNTVSASERANASNMLQNSCLGCNITRLQQGSNITGLPEPNLLTILMSQLARGLPPQIKHQDPVTVIDARNRPIPFFLDTIGSVGVCKGALLALT